MLWRTRRCPVDEKGRAWIDEQFAWLTAEFGEAALRAPVVLPTVEFFPRPYTPDRAGVLDILQRVCHHVGVDPDLVELETVENEADQGLNQMPFLAGTITGAAGDWRQRAGKTVIGLNESQLATPRVVVAVIAHELAHQRLLGENRIRTDRADGEQLTDLATVFFGLGIFNANASREFSSSLYGWQASTLGYLDERLFGFALARYAIARAEPRPQWAKYLDTNPRAFQQQSLQFLLATAPRD